MPVNHKKSILTTSILAALVLLQGCATNGGVEGAYPARAPKFVQGAAVGAVGGAAIGGLTSSGGSRFSQIPLGAVLGAMLGAPVGAYFDSQGLVNMLQANGITVIQLGDVVEVVIPNDIIFGVDGGNEVQREAYPLLDQVVSFLKQYGYVNMAVTGHSDIIGSNAQKIHASRLQAQSLATYIWAHGINIDRISIYGVGDHDTTASLRTVNGNGYNRRVEIYFWRKDKPSGFNVYTLGNDADCWTKADYNTCHQY